MAELAHPTLKSHTIMAGKPARMLLIRKGTPVKVTYAEAREVEGMQKGGHSLYKFTDVPVAPPPSKDDSVDIPEDEDASAPKSKPPDDDEIEVAAEEESKPPKGGDISTEDLQNRGGLVGPSSTLRSGRRRRS